MADSASQQGRVEGVTQSQSQQATEREALGGIPGLVGHTGYAAGQFWIQRRAAPRKALYAAEHGRRGGDPTPDERVDIAGRKVSPVKPSTAGRTRMSPGRKESAGC